MYTNNARKTRQTQLKAIGQDKSQRQPYEPNFSLLIFSIVRMAFLETANLQKKKQ